MKKLGNNTGRFANATLVRLNEFLSAGYKKGVRPVRDWRQSTTVAIDLMVYAILNVVRRILNCLLNMLAKLIIYILFCISCCFAFILLYVFCATQDEKNQVLTTYVWYRQV